MSDEELLIATLNYGTTATIGIEGVDAWLAGQDNSDNADGAGYGNTVSVSLPPSPSHPYSFHPQDGGSNSSHFDNSQARPEPQFIDSHPPNQWQEIADLLKLPQFHRSVDGALSLASGPSRYPSPPSTSSEPIHRAKNEINLDIDWYYGENISFPTLSGEFGYSSLPLSLPNPPSRSGSPPLTNSHGFSSSMSVLLATRGCLIDSPPTSKAAITPEQSLLLNPYEHTMDHQSQGLSSTLESAWSSGLLPSSTNATMFVDVSQASQLGLLSQFSRQPSEDAWLVPKAPIPSHDAAFSSEDIRRNVDWIEPSNHTSSFAIAAISATCLPGTHASDDYSFAVGYSSSPETSHSMDYSSESDSLEPFFLATDPRAACALNTYAPFHDSIEGIDSQSSSSDWTSPSTPSDKGSSVEFPTDDNTSTVLAQSSHGPAFRKFMPPYKAPPPSTPARRLFVDLERRGTSTRKSNVNRKGAGKVRSQKASSWKSYSPYILPDGKLGRHHPRK